jgi:uncharacterized repeat protein (TIGR03803 family)
MLHNFEVVYPGPLAPFATLLQGTDGKLYGTTYAGGDFNYGTVFSFELAVSLSVQSSGAGYQLRFSCFPSSTYEVQRAPDITGPWTSIDTQTASAAGSVESSDPSPLPFAGFYRARIVTQP